MRKGARVAQRRHDRLRRPDRLGDRPAPALRIPHRRRAARTRCASRCRPRTPDHGQQNMPAFRAHAQPSSRASTCCAHATCARARSVTKKAACAAFFWQALPARPRRTTRSRRSRCAFGFLITNCAPSSAFLVVDLRADQVLVAHRVDQQRDAVLLHRGVVFVDDLVEGEAVLESRAAAAGDEYAQLELGVALLVDQLPSPWRPRCRVKTSGRGISCHCVHVSILRIVVLSAADVQSTARRA